MPMKGIFMETLTLLTLFNLGISGGLSINTVSPNETGGLDYQYRVYNSVGRDYALSVFGDLSEKMRYNVRMTYNQNSTEIYHWLRTAEKTTQTMDGKMESTTLGFMLVPEGHFGTGFELFYGGGLYYGIALNNGFTGTVTLVENQDREVIQATDFEDQSFRSTSSALALSAGLRIPIVKRIKFSATADFLYFFRAKNLIFQDTGNVNELNFRAGLVYQFPDRREEKQPGNN